jgi:zinc protease
MPQLISSTPLIATSQLDIPELSAELHTLPNGLEVILHEDHHLPLVSVQVWVRAGSIHEENQTGAGLAHCVEHMMFKGTLRRSPEAITRHIQQHGGYVNAYTSFNRTVYWIEGLAEHSAHYLDILADMMQNARLDANDLSKEQDVIRREMAMDLDDPDSTLHHLMQATAFRRHPLRHPIIGHRQVFDQITHADLTAFVRRHYTPNNCFLVITGAIQPKRILQQIDRHFGSWQRSAYQPITLPTEPPLRGQRLREESFATDIARTAYGWHVPGEAHPDKAALDVIGMLLGSGRSSRLMQELREKRGIAHHVGAGAWYVPETGIFQLEADTDPADLPAAKSALLEVLQDFQQHGPQPHELEKALRATLNHQLRSRSQTGSLASVLGNSWLNSGGLDLPTRYLQHIRSLTPDHIMQVAQKHLNPDTWISVTLNPRASTPKNPVRRKKIARDNQPTPEVVDLDGLTLLLHPNPRLPLTSIRAQFLGGVLAETDSDAGVTLVASQMLLKGTATRSASQIQSELENLGGGLICQADAHRTLLGAEIMRGDEASAIDLISDLLFHHSLPESALALVKKQQIASIRQEQEDPLTVALRRARAEIFSGKPFARTALGTEASVNSLDINTCRQSLKRSFKRRNGILSVFGDIDPPAITRQIRQRLQSLPAGKRSFDPAKTHHSKAAPGRWQLHLPKEQAVLVIGFRTVDMLHPLTQTFRLIDEACSDMGSRLFIRIREELGLAYYVGAQAFSALSCGAFYFYLGTAPDKLDLAEEEMLKLIAELATHGLQDDELERAKTTWKSSWMRAQQGNGALADHIGWNCLSGLGSQHFSTLPEQVQAITPDQIRSTTRTWLQPKNAFIVRVSPT